MAEKEKALEKFETSKKFYNNLPARSRNWLPSVEEAEYYVKKNPKKYKPFLMWLLTVYGVPNDPGKKEKWYALVRLVFLEEETTGEKNPDKPIQDIYMQFEKYAQISNELDEQIGERTTDIPWPEVEVLVRKAHDDFPGNLHLFITLDEHGKRPETDLERRAKRYVSGVLRNHVIFTAQENGSSSDSAS